MGSSEGEEGERDGMSMPSHEIHPFTFASPACTPNSMTVEYVRSTSALPINAPHYRPCKKKKKSAKYIVVVIDVYTRVCSLHLHR